MLCFCRLVGTALKGVDTENSVTMWRVMLLEFSRRELRWEKLKFYQELGRTLELGRLLAQRILTMGLYLSASMFNSVSGIL